jgi:hypothetical protein
MSGRAESKSIKVILFQTTTIKSEMKPQNVLTAPTVWKMFCGKLKYEVILVNRDLANPPESYFGSGAIWQNVSGLGLSPCWP